MNDPGLTERTVIGGRYEILGLLGVGGMGRVYRARDVRLDEIIALKMLSRELAGSPDMLARFTQEVKLARKVTHKNVARTFDLGEDGGERFLTMELVEGESLAMRLARERRLPLAEALEIGCAICEGLEAAHAAGVVHRDLKPDNVLLGKDGRVVITDFGVARALENVGRRTLGAPVGTPAYMAPEQVEASPDVDGRADQYALAVMLFEMLTGVLPFEGSSPYAVAAARLVQPPPDPRALRPDLPDAIASVITTAMARRPEDRFGSMMEIATRLGGATLPAHSLKSLTTTPSGRHRVATEPGAKTIAVLPLRNAGAPDDAYVAEGLTEDLVDALSMTPGLRVRMASETSRDVRDVGRELGVQVVVDGSVRVSGDDVRLALRLHSVEDGFQLWAKRFEIRKSELLRAADQATSAIAEALTVERNTAKPVLADAAAIDLYLRGRHEYYKLEPSHVAKSIELFEQAVALRPDDPKLLSGLALACARWMNFVEQDVSGNMFPRAEEAIGRALAIDPHCADALAASAAVMLSKGEPVIASKQVAAALDVAPEHTDGHDIAARLLNEVGPRSECERHVARALAREPRLHHLQNIIARWAMLEGNFEHAKMLMQDPPEHMRFYVEIIRARVLLWAGDRASAARELERMATLDMPRREIISMMLGMIASREMPEALKGTYLQFAGRPGRAGSLFGQIGAEVCGFVGDKPGAFAFLRSAVEHKLFDIVWMDGAQPLSCLRDEPEFHRLRAVVAALADDVRKPLV